MTRAASGRLLVGTWIAAVGALVAVPWLGASGATIRLITLIAILSLVVSGLNLTLGYTGELALGQAAIYAAGAYATGFMATSVLNDMAAGMVASIVAALVVGVVTGLPGLRLGGWSLAITSFFVVLLIPSVIDLFGDRLGGYEGLTGIPAPMLFGIKLNREAFYVVVILVAAAWFVVFRNIAVSRHGASLLTLKHSPILAAAVGTSPYRTKVTAYAIGAIPAGIAGCFVAYLDPYLSPLSFGLELTITILAACILGGPATVYGAIVGAAIMQIGPLRVTVFDRYALIAYGAFLIIGGLVLRNGLAGLLRQVWHRVGAVLRRPPATLGHAADAVPGGEEVQLHAVAGLPLTVRNVTKRFGGNLAVDDVSFEAAPGQITALVGPNGSGKTTIMNLISGYYTLDGGSIRLGAQTLSGLPAHRVAQCGVGRTFQTPLVPAGLTVAETVMSGRLGTHRVSMLATALRLPRHWRALTEERRVSGQILRALGLSRLADTPAAELALGTRRLLELGRAIAGGSSLVLLDEVASGLDEEDIEGLTRVLRKLRAAGITIVLVEHNFALVRSVADRIVVLAEGKVIADGSPEQVASDPVVVQTYLGQSGVAAGARAAADISDAEEQV